MADATAAWNKAFTHGSKSLQDRLKKVHANNPAFQNWMKSSGHGTGSSVKQASKEVKSTERVKELQAKSLKAYGATKGQRMGSDDGSGETLRDTIAPLTRDQHSKAQAAERAAKAAAKPAKVAKPKAPLSRAERIAAIARAVTKSKAKDRFDVPTVNPEDMDHDDLRDVHNQLHVRGTYSEETEQVDEAKKPLKPTYWKAEWRLGTKSEVEKNHKKIYDRLSRTDPAKAKAFHDSLMRMKNKDVGAVHSSMEKEMQKEENVASEKEVKMAKGIAFDKRYKGGNMTAAAKAIDKIRPGLSNHPKVAAALRSANEETQMSYGKKIARAMLAKQSKHAIAQNMGEAKDPGEYDYEGDMAMSQLKSVIANAQKLHDMLEPDTNLPEWVQAKITLAEDYIVTAANYMDGQMDESAFAELDAELELFEKAPPGSKYERMVKHIKKGYSAGGLTPKEKSIAYATAWKAYNKANEEAELDEQSPSEIKAKYYHDQFLARAKSYAKADAEEKAKQDNYSKKYPGGEKQKAADKAAFLKRFASEEVEQVDESEKDWKKAFGAVASKNLQKDTKKLQYKVRRRNLVGLRPAVDTTPKVTAAVGKKGTYSEEVEQIDELKKSTLKSYVKKASGEMKKAYNYHQMRYGGRDGTDKNYMKNEYPKAVAKYDRRDAGVEKAKQKLAQEEIESVEEKYMGFKAVEKAVAAKGARNPAAVAAAIGRKKYGKEKFQAMAAAGKRKANEEVVTEAEGSVPTTPKEKELAAHHGDPNRITFGDVIKARLKSAAAKKMGK